MARSIEDTGYRHGYSVILCNSDRNVQKQRAYVRLLVDKHVDGIAFISSGESVEDIRYLTREGVAVVIVDRDQPGVAADVVLIDNERAGYEATRHLIGLQHGVLPASAARRSRPQRGASRWLPACSAGSRDRLRSGTGDSRRFRAG